MRQRQVGKAWLIIVLGVPAGAVAAAVGAAAVSDRTLDVADKMSGVAGFPLAAAGLMVAAVSLWFGARSQPSAAQPPATDTLATGALKQLRIEARIRRLDGADLMPVSWTVSRRALSASVEEILAGSVGGRPTSLRLSGNVLATADTFTRLPHKRLVILGEPGSGKSVLALTLALALLERRRTGETVPLLVTVRSWRAGDSFATWLTRLIGEEYGTGYRELVRANLILPVLDGLDELAPGDQRSFYQAVDLAAAAGLEFVLTCRRIEYTELVECVSRPLAGAVVAELAPLTAVVLGSYLRGAEWSKVRSALFDEAYPELLRALSSPLILHLARTVYGRPGGVPDDLLRDLADLPQNDIEQRLLTAYLPTVYSAYSSGQAERALTALVCLARRADQTFSWWSGAELVRWWALRTGVTVAVLAPILMAFTTMVAGLRDGTYTFEATSFTSAAVVLGFVAPTLKAGNRLIKALQVRYCATSFAVLAVGYICIRSAELWVTFGYRYAFDGALVLLTEVHIALTWMVAYLSGRWMQNLSAPGRKITRALALKLTAALAVIVFLPTWVWYGWPWEMLVIALAKFILCGLGCVGVALLVQRSATAGSRVPQRGVSGATRVGGATGVAVAVGFLVGDGTLYEMVGALLFGIAAAFLVGALSAYHSASKTTGRPSFAFAQSATAASLVFSVFLVTVVVLDLANRPTFGVWDHLTAGLWFAVPAALLVLAVTLISFAIQTPLEDLDRMDPAAALRRDRRAALLILALIASVEYAFSADGLLVFACTVTGILVLSFTSRWPAFIVARFWWSVVDRELPWALMEFLADAHRRGVLRRVGSAYQFRHLRIRQYLACSDGVALSDNQAI